MHKENIRCINFNNNGNLLASGSDDNKIILWNMELN